MYPLLHFPDVTCCKYHNQDNDTQIQSTDLIHIFKFFICMHMSVVHIHVCLLLCNPTTCVDSSFHHHSPDTRLPSLQRSLRLPCCNNTCFLPARLAHDGTVLMREKEDVIGLHCLWNQHHCTWFQLLILILPYLMTI